jgi:uncharacterized protein Veg
MRKKSQSLEGIKQKITALSGKTVNMCVCRGRKQVKKYSGIIENVYPSVFVVRICIENTASVPPCLSYSYNDILCGEVQIDEVS